MEVSVTLNWVEGEGGAGGEIGGKCISGYRQYAIRSIVGKARLDRAYPRYEVSSSLVAGSRGLRRGVKRHQLLFIHQRRQKKFTSVQGLA